MSHPILKVNAGIYSLVWEAEQIGIRIDRLRNHSDSLSGEITVMTRRPGYVPHLHQARLNLTSTSARRTLAKHLQEIQPDPDLNWGAIVEDACIMTLEQHRLGEPVVELHDVKPRTGPQHRLAPLLLEGHPNYLYGDGATGKSWLAAFCAVLVSSGFHHCGLDPLPGRALYLDYEMSAEEMRERILAIEAGLGEADCSQIHYRFCVAPLADDIETIQAIVAEQEIDLVIVDSAGPALGGEKGDPKDPVIEYFRALRSLRCSTLTVDHVTKSEGGRKLPYGSIYKFNLARNVFEMRKSQETGEDNLTAGVYHRKSNFGPLLRPMGFKLAFSGDAVYFTTANVRDVPALAEGMSARDRLLAFLLSEGPATVADMAAALEMTATMVRARLNDGRGKCFTQVDDAREPKWAALSKEEA